MPGNTFEEAFDAFADPIKDVIRCLDPNASWTKTWLTHHAAWRLGTSAKSPVQIDCGGRVPYYLAVAIDVFPVLNTSGPLPLRVTTVKYIYELSLNDDETRSKRIYAWHWHPDSTHSPAVKPHVHASSSALHPKTHVPAGRVSIEEIALYLIDDLKAKCSDGARERIEASVEKHEEYRKWHSAQGAKRTHVSKADRMALTQNGKEPSAETEGPLAGGPQQS